MTSPLAVLSRPHSLERPGQTRTARLLGAAHALRARSGQAHFPFDEALYQAKEGGRNREVRYAA